MWLLPSPPAEAAVMTAWAEHGHPLLSWSDDLLFFAVICWEAAARGLSGPRETEP
ncbi:hypothetical protein MF672_013990 [Actinomadura sp. ATCC 31491]|uniref:Uncharacterized protein n=1 Tax=Actinomadura luzonensis TaxID=2805427 RepID=A0ABT0FRE8_9ACTN|nr:hypothetical protein [Actinomadura luzonensis]MCK2214892.1 hypothetical protein [Actinomadura luzonensis]